MSANSRPNHHAPFQPHYAPPDAYAHYTGAAWQQQPFRPQQYYPRPYASDPYASSSSGYPHQQAFPHQQYASPYQHHTASAAYPGAYHEEPSYPGPIVSPAPHPAHARALETQLDHLHLAPEAGSSRASSAPASRSASGGGKSDIALRYPRLPIVPAIAPAPAALAAADAEVGEYVAQLHAALEAYERRDEMLRLRTEAVGFEPRRAYLAWQHPSSDNAEEGEGAVNAVLGVRLLQRLDAVQRENAELGGLLARAPEQRRQLEHEVHECHTLIDALDSALTHAQQHAQKTQQALDLACASNSTAIVSTPPQPTHDNSIKSEQPTTPRKGAPRRRKGKP
ncbi:uncharacterized protein PAN0_003c1579 [Moesziomyces antarcticus]|uniref:Uncharacterized protein n=1 Tax=Pseudozyma antarctica TaxID=84753 RepID=A0A5C3FHV2_PSEA2|nr:uncharacterized protein PAN0_003c1579 [Moesziomyces antarcticus]GAK63375.1 hypothetical protein PAN0_003c1579 [Moesziomyces antarcticus]SPO43958.1 uncharacterized protein PSANT_01643 [Moesziomyces antarcticus]